MGPVPALTDLAERLADHTGLRIHRDLERDLSARSSEVELAVLRVAQGSLANATRHAGAARVDLSLRARRPQVELCVRDDGRGMERGSGSGAGIRSIRERARAVEAALTITPREDAPGTRVRLLAQSRQP